MGKKLYRTTLSDRRIAGVCGGFAKYFELGDPTWIRLVWALLLLAGGMSLWVYAICWLVMPEEPVSAGAPEEQ
ncbi:MAG: PspC domain-containing protein [Bacteroidales bacterium]|nr:PspC domain-containing protein [Bacteroidales bacterium]